MTTWQNPDIAAAMASDDFQRDPYPPYGRLSQEAPLYCHPRGFCCVSRYADVDEAFRDLLLSNDRDRLTASVAGEGAEGQRLQQLMTSLGRVITNTDPPAHGRLRRLVN